MTLLVQFCERLMHLNDRYRRVFLRVRPAGDRNVATEHSEIAQGAVARDVDFATDRLREHILRTGANLMTHLEIALAAKQA
jgi:DNA-binding GntR family transcriptional regulator